MEKTKQIDEVGRYMRQTHEINRQIKQIYIYIQIDRQIDRQIDEVDGKDEIDR